MNEGKTNLGVAIANELALKKYDDLEFRIGTEKELADSDEYIRKYIDNAVKIYIDGEYIGEVPPGGESTRISKPAGKEFPFGFSTV